MCKEAARLWGDLICWSWCGTKIFVLDSVRCSWFITANTDRVEQVVVVKGTGWIVAAGGDERPKLCLLSMGQPRSVNCLWQRCHRDLFLSLELEQLGGPSERQGSLADVDAAEQAQQRRLIYWLPVLFVFSSSWLLHPATCWLWSGLTQQVYPYEGSSWCLRCGRWAE